MLGRLCFFIDTIFSLIKVNNGYVRTYADDYYGRIRGSNQATGIDAGVIFLIVFGCLIGGFFIFCILGTIIFGIFDNGFRCPERSFLRRNKSLNPRINPFISSNNSRL